MTEKTSYAPGEPIWADLATPDIDTTIAFYGALFGWECDRARAEQFGGYSNFRLRGKAVAGVMPLMDENMPPVWSVYVCTDDSDKTVAKVTEAGGSVVAPPMDVAELGQMAVFSGADGSFFGTWKPGTHLGSELVGEEGTLSWIELATRDKDASLAFYEKVFGWGANVNPGYTEFTRAGESVAGCMDMPEMVPAGVPNYWMPYFQADDPKAQGEKAVSLGGTLVVPFMEMDNVAFSVVNDLHGSMFGLLKLTH